MRAVPFALAACAGVLAFATPAHAIRPFVTDDARVVGEGLAQLETWVHVDRLELGHNALGAFGPTNWLELTLGFAHGGVYGGPANERGYAFTGPIMQGKALLLPAHNNSWPGFAVATGALPPWGVGAFPSPGWGTFAYAAATETLLDEAILIHANLGFALGDEGTDAVPGTSRVRSSVTAGLGTQLLIVGGFHGVAEIYYGDPYDPRANYAASQLGCRYIFSDHVQMDGTFGTTLEAVSSAGEPSRYEQWGSMGIRLVTSPLW